MAEYRNMESALFHPQPLLEKLKLDKFFTICSPNTMLMTSFPLGSSEKRPQMEEQ